MENWNKLNFFNVNCNLFFIPGVKIAVTGTIYTVADCPKYCTSTGILFIWRKAVIS